MVAMPIPLPLLLPSPGRGAPYHESELLALPLVFLVVDREIERGVFAPLPLPCGERNTELAIGGGGAANCMRRALLSLALLGLELLLILERWAGIA